MFLLWEADLPENRAVKQWRTANPKAGLEIFIRSGLPSPLVHTPALEGYEDGEGGRRKTRLDGWVRRVSDECLDHLILFGMSNLQRALRVYVSFFNSHRPIRGSVNRYLTGGPGEGLSVARE